MRNWVFEDRDTVSVFGPGPLIVMLLSITSSPLVKPMVPVTAKVILSPSFALTSACRNEPGPLSFVLVTVMMVARVEIVIAQSRNRKIGTPRLKRNREGNFFFTC